MNQNWEIDEEINLEEGDIEELEEKLIERMVMVNEDMHHFMSNTEDKRNIKTMQEFLGKHRYYDVPVVRPDYYNDLLAWSLKHYIEDNGWKVVKVLGIEGVYPNYTRVNINYGVYEQALCEGRLLLEKNGNRIIASISMPNPFRAQVTIRGIKKKITEKFAMGVSDLAKGANLYQGKKLEYDGSISFIKAPLKKWEDIALSPDLKEEIITNTVGIIQRKEDLAKYGIPCRRGIILAGEPGTGKTLVCKILMSQSDGITCVTANSSMLLEFRYIQTLYQLAQDLKPTIIFLEDIDLVGVNRRMAKIQAMPTLLACLDGIEENQEIITVATTNFLDEIDDALRKRPSRFDRIIQIEKPGLKDRRNLLQILSQRIQISEEVREYLEIKTDGCTPAEIQEIVYSLVIEHKHNQTCAEGVNCQFTIEDAEKTLKVNKNERKLREIGFIKMIGNNVKSSGQLTPLLNKNKCRL